MATIEFIDQDKRSSQRRPQTLSGMKKLINYVLNPIKTSEAISGGRYCSPETAYNEFLFTKRLFCKTEGRLFRHFVQSFSPTDNVTPQTAKDIAERLLSSQEFNGFQILYAVHTDKAHIHTHFVVNTVSVEDGHKWQQSSKQLQELKNMSDQICAERGLSVIPPNNHGHKSRGEYRSEKNGNSWKFQLYTDVTNSLDISRSRNEFINNLALLGYSTKWTDKDKYVTFTTPEGKKCRNSHLYPQERFLKESMEKRFAYNLKNYGNASKEDILKHIAKQTQLGNQLNAATNVLSAVASLSKDDDHRQMLRLSKGKFSGKTFKERLKEIEFGEGIDWERE